MAMLLFLNMIQDADLIRNQKAERYQAQKGKKQIFYTSHLHLVKINS